MYSSSTRTRSGSVGRGERDPIPYRTSYGKDVTSSIPSRYSRASSYDPFSSRLPKSPSMSSSYNRPSYSSVSSTPMSHSYHTDYTPRPLTTRYGSTDQLSSASSYKSPYSSGMSSSYRTPDHTSSYRERPTYRASSTFTPRTSSYSDSRPSRDLPPVVRDYSSSNLSKYRPDVSTSYSRPSYTSTSSYTPRGRYEYRSKTPGVTSNYGSTVSSSGTGGRFDRDCKSMTRFEKTTKPEKQEESTDDVEATFQKLYNRYVKDIESDTEPEKPKQEKPVYTRKFISHSEAEEETSEEEESPYEDDSFAEQLRIREANQKKPASLTPRESSCDVTPQASPLPKKKVQIDDVKTIPGPLVKTEPEKKEIPQKKEAVPTRIEPSSTASPAQRFKEQHHDVEMKPAVIAARDLKPAASAMDKMLRRDSLTTKLTEAMVKKKSPTPTPKDSVAAPTVKAASPLSTTSKTVPPQPAQPKSRSATPTLPKQPSTSKPVTTTDASGKPATKGQEAAGSSSAAAPVKPVSKPAGPATPALKPTEVKRAVTPEVKKAVQPEVKKTPPQEIRKAVTPERGTSTSKSLTPSKSSSPLPDSKKVTESKNAPKPVAPLSTLPVTKTDSGSRSKSPAKDSVSTAPKDVKTTTRESSPGVSVKKTAEPPVKVDTSKEKLKTRSPSPKPPVTQTKPNEPTSDVTITLPQSTRSRSSSPAARKPRDRSKSRGERGETPQFLTVNPSSSRKTRDGSPSKMRRSASPTSQIELERDDRSKSVGEAAEKTASLRKRRDPTRTLDNLKETLEPLLQQKRKEMEQSATEASEAKETIAELPSTCRPPLLLVTQPSMPSTPRLSSAGIDWDVSNSEGEWTEAEDEQEYESDYEYSISQTFKIRERLPLGDLYPISPPSSRCSPFVSDYDSDSSMPFMVTQSREEDSRGRVDRLFAVPPPTFTCSVTYDGQESWDSDDSVHSCEDDFDDAYTGACPRGGSSSLGFYLSPATYSTEDDSLYQDSVDVGCTLKLVDRMAMRDSDDEYTDDSEYYDDEYSDEEYYDEDEEYEYEEEEYEEEYEEEEEEEEEEMLSFAEEDEKSLSPMITQSAAMEEGEEMVFEEMDDHFEEVAPFHSAVSEEVAAESTAADKHREITYTKDVQLKHEEEVTGQLELEKNEKAKAVAKKITKDGKSGKVEKHMVTQQVAPAHELIAEASTEVLPEEEMIGLDLQEHLETTGTREVSVVPTYVRPSTEKVEQESASRFSEKKPTTDFAKKAVIQPNKLETVKVNKTETKLATVKPKEEEKPKATAKPAPELKSTESKTSSVIKKEPTKPEELKTDTGTSAKKLGAPETKPSATAQAETVKSSKEAEDKTGTLRKDVTSKTPEATKKTKAEEKMEDKSGIRKSALNMTAEEAKKKAKMDEEAAKQKARRLGTVSALMNRFKDEPKEPEPVLYKRSSRLTQRDEEKPKRKYEIVKPVLNDEFDKQMEEIRAQMKAGSSQFQTELKSLSKGISTVTEETKKRELEEKHKSRLDKASGVFSKADEEKMRWKEKRDAETDKELTKIEAAKGHKTKVVTAPEPAPQEPKKEPKRTIRKINRNKSPAVEAESEAFKPTTSTPAPSAVKDSTSIKTIPTGKVEPVAVPQTASDKKIPTAPLPPTAPPAPLPRDMFKREKTPVVKPADSLQKPSAPKADLVIDDSNFALFAAATAVATRKKRMPWEPKIKKEAEKSEEDKTVPTRKTSVPKGDGAAATKIRNAMGNMANSAEKGAAGHEKSSRRYSTRRKTQEIVNESVQPKRRRKDKSRRNRFIRDPHDIDIILGWEKENTFELMERMFAQAANDKIQYPSSAKKRRLQSSKIWISELTDIDKIYKQSEIRDIAASVHG